MANLLEKEWEIIKVFEVVEYESLEWSPVSVKVPKSQTTLSDEIQKKESIQREIDTLNRNLSIQESLITEIQAL